MDVLGNILKNMTKPPVMAADAGAKKRLEEGKRLRLEEQRKVQTFQEQISARISKFMENDTEKRLELEPMSKPQRAVAYDVLENLPYDLVPHSFGREEVDRRLIIFKPEHVPCDAELQAMKRGEEYVPVAPREDDEEDETPAPTTTKNSDKKQPEYLQKYAKYLGDGLEDAKESARSTETKRMFGCVSSEMKKDKRTIEETLADIQAKKKLKQ